MFLFGNKKNGGGEIAVVDCPQKKISIIPLHDGADMDENGNFRTDFPAVLTVRRAGGKVFMEPLSSEGQGAVLNSAPLSQKKELQSENTLQYRDKIYFVLCGSDAAERAKKVDLSKWQIFNTESGAVEDVAEFDKIKASVQKRGLTGKGLAVCPKGISTGFFFSQIFPEQAQNSAFAVNASEGEIVCPLCWLKFDVGDAMSIAVHESLRGDPVLGPEEMLRFLPTSFNSDGIAIDPAGMPAHDIACPHCRKRLPPGYLDVKRHIFSIVGAPSSGKSYYLSVLIKELQTSLYKYFNATFKDLDPSGNMLLTQMKNRLFSAENPEDAILAKTALEGAMYERYPRFGKIVALPKPMTYSLGKTFEDGSSLTSALIFYDNAGEHFEPGLDMEDSPGALHVASSDGIFFLFDPASNRNFKRMIHGKDDPQLKIGGRLDQQDTILAEMEIRIKRILGLGARDKIDTPLAVILGKCDLWLDLLPEPLAPYVSGSSVNFENIEKNSASLRSFMLSVDPSIVYGAEAISKNVRFFAVSSLGHSPIKIESGPQAGKIAPVPSLLNPINAEIPTVWALSQKEPDLLKK